MQVNIRADSVVIEGYVNAIERDSKPLWSRMGQFVERICKGAFKRALERNNDVKLLLNHDKFLGSTRQGNLELKEDNIGLHARATITDEEVIEKARNGKLVGWSFGFYDRPNGVIKRMVDGKLHRNVEDLDLNEVTILDNTRNPAYDGTLIMAREADGQMQFRAEPFIDEVKVVVENATPEQKATNEETSTVEEKREEQTEPKQQEVVKKNIDYSEYRKIIDEMKED